MNKDEEAKLVEEIMKLLSLDKTKQQKKLLDKKVRKLEVLPKSLESYSYIFEAYEQDSLYPAIDEK